MSPLCWYVSSLFILRVARAGSCMPTSDSRMNLLGSHHALRSCKPPVHYVALPPTRPIRTCSSCELLALAHTQRPTCMAHESQLGYVFFSLLNPTAVEIGSWRFVGLCTPRPWRQLCHPPLPHTRNIRQLQAFWNTFVFSDLRACAHALCSHPTLHMCWCSSVVAHAAASSPSLTLLLASSSSPHLHGGNRAHTAASLSRTRFARLRSCPCLTSSSDLHCRHSVGPSVHSPVRVSEPPCLCAPPFNMCTFIHRLRVGVGGGGMVRGLAGCCALSFDEAPSLCGVHRPWTTAHSSICSCPLDGFCVSFAVFAP
jgi:hypothetical protein